MDSSLVLLHLSLIKGIGPAIVQLLIENKQESWQWQDLYHMLSSDIVEQCGLSVEKAILLAEGLRDRTLLDKECAELELNSIKWTTILSDLYPESLKHIHLPPIILYWQGENPVSSANYMSVVGSRAMNRYGKMAIEQLVPPLVGAGWSIVSGGAIGVDSYAHLTTLKSNGTTLVVLGSGLLRPYPASNKKLFKAVVASGGTIISPFPVCMEAYPPNFPARNRVISGLSRGCLVVQAAAKSGARITAQFALEQGRDVFAVPGPIDDPLSSGCHALIKQGAKLVQSADDILEEYGQLADARYDQVKSSDSVEVSNLTIPGKTFTRSISSGAKATIDDPITEQIMSRCVRPIPFDELALLTGLESSDLHEKLFELQLQGLVCQQIGLWCRC